MLLLPLLFLTLVASVWLVHHRARWRARRYQLVAALPLLAACTGAAITWRDLASQKVLALVLMPAGLVSIALAVLATQACMFGTRARAAGLCGVFLLHAAAGSPLVGCVLLRSLESPIPPLSAVTREPLDALLVLGGGTRAGEFGGAALGDAGDRVALAARLYLRGDAGVLVASGRSIGGVDGPARDLSKETFSIWRSLGVPERSILSLPEGRNTAEEVVAYRRLARERGWTRVGLVSSAWHLPRALRLCERAGLEVVPVGADRSACDVGLSAARLVPQAAGFERTQRALWEHLGALVGR